jgi:hypothetical protein
VAEQPSGPRYAVRRLRIQRLILPNDWVADGGGRQRSCRFALGQGLVLRWVEEIGEFLNAVNQPGAGPRPRRVRIHRNEPNPRG